MAKASVTALRSVEIGVTNVEEQVNFYKNVWCVDPVIEANGAHYFRGTGPFHHILSLRQTPKGCVIRLVFDAADRAAVDALHAQVKAHGIAKIDPPGNLDWPGGGYGFG